MRETWMDTFTGKRIDVLRVQPDDVCIEDIAHSLALQCRFNGHTPRFYSVAEHSVRVSELCEKIGYNRETRLMALLHDAAEAYLGDIIRPVKYGLGIDAMPFDRIDAVVMHKFGCEDGGGWGVTGLDLELLLVEGRDVMGRDWSAEYGKPVTDYCITETWDWPEAECRFLERAKSLGCIPLTEAANG